MVGRFRSTVDDQYVPYILPQEHGHRSEVRQLSLTDEAGKPLPAVPVNISGPDALQDATNAEGCAVFGHIPTGTYGISVNQLGYVDPSGNQQISQTKTVSPQTVQTVALQYAPVPPTIATFTRRPGQGQPRRRFCATQRPSSASR